MSENVTGIVIEPVPAEVVVRYSGRRVILAEPLAAAIETHWKARARGGARFHRGAVFSVASVRREPNALIVQVDLTDYAHYVYTIDGHYGVEGACRVVYSAAVVVTSDEKFVFGQMAAHTSTPGRLTVAGGSLDLDDLDDGEVDLAKSLRHELAEELGLDPEDPAEVRSLVPRYLKSGGANGFFGVFFDVHLGIPWGEAAARYAQHVDNLQARGITPEFDELVAIDRTPTAVGRFFRTDVRDRADYLRDLLTLDAQRSRRSA